MVTIKNLSAVSSAMGMTGVNYIYNKVSVKTLSLFMALLSVVIITASCGTRSVGNESPTTDAGTKVYAYKDSCQNLLFSLSIELPLGKDSTSLQIRDSLIAEFVSFISRPGFIEEGTPSIKPFAGDADDIQGMVDYYGKAANDELLKSALSDYEQRMQYLDEDTTMTEDDRQRIKQDVPMWALEYKLSMISSDTLDIVTYDSQAYVYYGGAHGGVIGSGAMTFDKLTGEKISHFIDPAATERIQPMLRKGLLQYYAEVGDTISDSQLSERLQIEGTVVPQPHNTPSLNLSCDSLVFVYGQYEIACYADGMPSFRIPVSELIPYLTPQGKNIIDRTLRSKARR